MQPRDGAELSQTTRTPFRGYSNMIPSLM
jgi:hypothetical protein